MIRTISLVLFTCFVGAAATLQLRDMLMPPVCQPTLNTVETALVRPEVLGHQRPQPRPKAWTTEQPEGLPTTRPMPRPLPAPVPGLHPAGLVAAPSGPPVAQQRPLTEWADAVDLHLRHSLSF